MIVSGKPSLTFLMVCEVAYQLGFEPNSIFLGFSKRK
jgi:hypothetical protein